MKKTMMLFLTFVVILSGLGVASATDGDFNTNCQWDNNGNLNDEDNDECDEDDRDNDECDEDDRDNDECDEDDKDNDEDECIEGRVWNDLNANGIEEENEPGISGIIVNLWTGDKNGPKEQTDLTTTTDANGNYSFKDLWSDTFWLQFVIPDEFGTWIFSPQQVGDDGSINSDANAAGIVGPIKLKCHDCQDDWDAGLYQLAAIGDRVWVDTNKNGIQDAGEPGQAGVIVNLLSNVNNAPGSIIKTTTTDANGAYAFINLVPGTYWLQFVLPDAISTWIFTLQNQGTDDAIDSDANASGIIGPIELISGELDLTLDAGLDPGSAAGGDEEPTDGAAGGEEEIIEVIPEEVAAAGEEVALQETGVPIGLFAMAVLMVLAGLVLPKRK